MRRSGLIYCADCTAPHFKALRARGQLPFSTFDDDITGWQNFSLADAFQLRLMLDFTEQDGIGNDLARYAVIEGTGRRLSMHPLNYPRSQGDMWAAVALVELPISDSDAQDTGDRTTYFALGGRLEDLPRLVAERIENHFFGSQLVRIVAANASRAAHFVRRRAHALGLPEGDDFTPVWKDWTWPEWVEMPERGE